MCNNEIDESLMTDEEIDNYYRPKKTNSRKSLAPLFVYLILKKYSSSEKHLRHNEIIELLKNSPYEIEIERKALGRIIHNLTDSYIDVYSDSKGTWYDEYYDY